MRIKHDNKLMICLALFLFLVEGLIMAVNYAFVENLYISISLDQIYYLLPFFLIAMWAVSVNFRIIYRDIRIMLECISICMVMLIASMICRYQIVKDIDLLRYVGYMFQISFFAICYLSLITALQIGRSHKKRSPAYWITAAGLGLIVELVIVTNDYHQLIYDISPEGKTWTGAYCGGPLYGVLLGLEAVIGIATIVVIWFRCRKSINSYKIKWLLAGTIAVVSVYGILYSISDIHIYKQPVASCFITIAIWEICINQRVFPSNSGYEKFFTESSVPMLITNMKGLIIYSSRSAELLSKEQLKNAISRSCIINGTHRLSSHAIKGGRCYWMDDIVELNSINEDLKNVVLQLEEQGEILDAEENIRSERRRIDVQNSVWEKLAIRNQKNFERMREALEKSDNRGDAKTLLKVCVEMTFWVGIVELKLAELKREKESIAVLETYLKEFLQQLELYGIRGDMQIDANGYISSESMYMLYTRFGEIVVENYEKLNAIEILVKVFGSTLKMKTKLLGTGGEERTIGFAVSKVGEI